MRVEKLIKLITRTINAGAGNYSARGRTGSICPGFNPSYRLSQRYFVRRLVRSAWHQKHSNEWRFAAAIVVLTKKSNIGQSIHEIREPMVARYTGRERQEKGPKIPIA
jgi:hypothetical protein